MSLALVFPFVNPFEDREAGLFGVRHGKGLQFDWGIESREDLAHGFFAGRTIRQRPGGKRAAQGELPAAHGAAAFG